MPLELVSNEPSGTTIDKTKVPSMNHDKFQRTQTTQLDKEQKGHSWRRRALVIAARQRRVQRQSRDVGASTAA